MQGQIDDGLMGAILAEADAQDQAAARAADQAAHDEDLAAAANELAALKDTIEELEAQKKAAQERFDQLRKSVIPDLMRKKGLVTSSGKGSFTFAGGRLALVTDTFASCRADQQAALAEYLRANGAGDLVKPTVNAATLKAHCKELRENGQPLPPMVTVYEEQKVTLTRDKKTAPSPAA